MEADETGRGLILVDTLAAAWGTAGDAAARWVWADVPWPADNGAPDDWREPANAAARALAGLQQTYPGTLAWYGQQTRSWWASLPGSPGSTPDRLLTAPCLTALSQALAARHLASSRP